MFGENGTPAFTCHLAGPATAARKENLWGMDLARDQVTEFPDMDAGGFAFSRFPSILALVERANEQHSVPTLVLP